MASSPLGSNGNLRRSESPRSDTRAAGQSAADRELLARVLEWTEAAIAADDPLEAADLDDLRTWRGATRASPCRHGRWPWNWCKPCSAVSIMPMPDWVPVWRDASELIAETLLEDPTSRERLEVLWSRLTNGER